MALRIADEDVAGRPTTGKSQNLRRKGRSSCEERIGGSLTITLPTYR